MVDKKETRSNSLGSDLARVLKNYFKTQFLLIIIITVVVWVILSLLGVKFAILLAFVTGALGIVPFWGMTLASIMASLVAILDKEVFLKNAAAIWEGVIVLAIFIALNQLIDLFLSPYLMAKTGKINPLVLFISVILASFLFGPVGAFLVIPFLLVVKTIFKHAKTQRFLK